MARAARPIKERLSSLVKRVNGCWEWQGHLTYQGYGQIGIGSRTDKTRMTRHAHIVSYETFIGEVPSGLVLDHLCRNRRCVNPEHLEPVTVQENIRRGQLGLINRSKTHCPQGHEYSESNTWRDKLNQRHCRTCRREANYGAFLRRRIASSPAL